MDNKNVKTKRLGSTAKFNDITLDKPIKTTEEFDCERRGYKLTKTCLGTGAYAKVKLAYVTNAKLEKDKRLAEQLKGKGTNKVNYIKTFLIKVINIVPLERYQHQNFNIHFLGCCKNNF